MHIEIILNQSNANIPMDIIIQIIDFEQPFNRPPKKYHIKRKTISSISVDKLNQVDLRIISFNDKK